MKKLVALVMALLLALGTCVALAEDAEEYTPDLTGKKIGISFYAYASTSAIRQLDYLIYCLEEAGAEVAYAIANSSVEQHLADIDSLIEQEIDALILDPCQTDGFESGIQACKDAGVPVFLMGNYLNPDIYVAGEDYVTLLNSDFETQGYNTGLMAVEAAQEKLNGQGNAIILFGTPGQASATGRIEGVERAVNENDGVTIIGSQSAYNRAADAQNITENYLLSSGGPDVEGGVNLIICLTHNCAVGAISGVKNMGYQCNEDVVVIVCDGVKEDLQSIMDGDLYGAVESPTFYAAQQVEILDRYFKGETLETYYPIETTIFTPENAQEWYNTFDGYDQLIGLE